MSEESGPTTAQKTEQFDIVMSGLLDAVTGFEGKVGAGVVAYGLLVLGCQLAHDYCPEDQNWKDLVDVAVSGVRAAPESYGSPEEGEGAEESN